MNNDADTDRSVSMRGGRLEGGRIDRWSLRFADPALEQEFERHRIRSGLGQIRAWGALGILGYCLFGFLEWYLTPERLALSLLVRYAIPVPVFVATLSIAFTSHHYERYLVRMLELSVLLAGASTIVMVCLSTYPDDIVYLFFMVVVALFLHGHMGIRFFRAFFVSWSLMIGLVLAVVFVDPALNTDLAVMSVVAVVLANLMVMFVSYNFEIFLRRDFRNNRLLLQQLNATEVMRARAQTAETRLMDAIESISDGFALYDRKDRLVMFNQRWLSVNDEIRDVIQPGMTYTEVLRKVVAAGRVADAKGREAEWTAARIKSHQEGDGASVRQTKGGRVYLLKERATADDGVVGVWSDITELEALQEKLLQSQKLEAIGGLTGGVAHEFNNLLMVVQGNVEALRPHLEHDAKAKRFIERALKGVSRGADLTARLLTFARRQRLRRDVLDTNAIVTELSEVLRPSLGERVTLAQTLSDRMSVLVGDRNQLENAILNLVLNARDAMPDGGSITIETDTVVLDETAAKTLSDDLHAGSYIVVAVIDNGEGMPAEVVEHVFEPFFTTKQVGQGTGLGLSMVWGFVKQTGGHVQLQSTPGNGTRVRMYFPAAAQDHAIEQTAASPEPRVARTRGRILVVEDDADVRATVVAMLEALGYTVDEATTADEALAKITGDDPIDLIFSDVVMPGRMSADDLARAARAHNPRLKVLFTTGYDLVSGPDSDNADEDASLLYKPYRAAELQRRIQSLLG